MWDFKPRETPRETKLEYAADAERMTDPRRLKGYFTHRRALTRPRFCRFVGYPNMSQTCVSMSQMCIKPWVMLPKKWDTKTRPASVQRRRLGFRCDRQAEHIGISWRWIYVKRVVQTTRKQATLAPSPREAGDVSSASAMQECIYWEQILKNIDKQKYLRRSQNKNGSCRKTL